MVMKGQEIVVNGVAKHIPISYLIGKFFDGMYGKIVVIILYTHKVEPGPLIVLVGVQEQK